MDSRRTTMCIIVISENKPLVLEDFKDFNIYNADGAGIMVAHDGKVETFVSLGTPEEIYAEYTRMYELGSPVFLHYRMKTHGDINLANTHPYLVYTWEDGKELWMMHNGILHTGNDADKTMSDTWHFIRDRLQTLCRDFPKWYMNEHLLAWLGEFIGNNRFVFLDSDGDSAVVNHDQWTLHNEHLYSNEYAWSVPRKAYTKPAMSWFQNTHLSTYDEVPLAHETDMYGVYTREINTYLPVSCIHSWGTEAVKGLEEFIELDTFIDALYVNTYQAADIDLINTMLSAHPVSIQDADVIYDVLYEYDQ